MARFTVLALLALAGCAGESAPDSLIANSDAFSRQACGGFAALECPGGQTCVDDPSDACDPDQGDADCIGMCIGNGVGNGNGNGNGGVGQCGDPSTKTYVSTDLEQCAAIRFLCDGGTEPFFNDCGCGCEEVEEACGDGFCDVGDVCCNDSCGICTPPGGVCTQQVCE